jgi:hypothetical protein
VNRERLKAAPDSGIGLKSRVDRGEVAEDGIAEDSNGPDAHDGDQADEHAVLDKGRTLIVLHETRNELTHLKYPYGLVDMTGLHLPRVAMSQNLDKKQTNSKLMWRAIA